MNLQDELKLRTGNSSLKQIAEIMGYSARQSVRAADRLHKVINSGTLGLDAGGYDFKYTDAEFVLKLCEVLKMDMAECTRQVEAISNQLFEARMAYKPWVSIITEPIPATRTIQVFGFPQGVKQIMLPHLTQVLLHQQIREVKPLIIKHYEDNDGRLPLWGCIKRYLFRYGPESTVVFDTGGTVVDAGECNIAPAATITVNGSADLTKIIKVAGKSQ